MTRTVKFEAYFFSPTVKEARRQPILDDEPLYDVNRWLPLDDVNLLVIRIRRVPRRASKGNLNGLLELPSDSVPMIDLGNPPGNGYDTGSIEGSRDTQWIRERPAGVQIGVRGRLDAVVVCKRIDHFYFA